MFTVAPWIRNLLRPRNALQHETRHIHNSVGSWVEIQSPVSCGCDGFSCRGDLLCSWLARLAELLQSPLRRQGVSDTAGVGMHVAT
ncbi:hypothetical protein Q9966_001526 [Columba livia]|nr:hypothetical protein Q9966_001526 [Columba livia]